MRQFLELNVSKTKELVINFRRAKNDMEPIVVRGQPVEIVENYKYLGTIIDANSNSNSNSNTFIIPQEMHNIEN